MVTNVWSCGLTGMEGELIRVEVDASNGLPAYDTVGLPDKAVLESRERVRSSLRNSGYPSLPRRITVNLAPAHLRKVGSVYDLPIALALLQSLEVIHVPQDFLEESMVVGELSLGGDLRPVNGVLSMALTAKKHGHKRLICPLENAGEACYVEGLEILSASTLRELCEMLEGSRPTVLSKPQPWMPLDISSENDFSLIRGQFAAKRAAEIAAAGGHNMLMVGAPGGGKTMLAKAIPGILPDLSFAESLEISTLYSVAGQLGHGGLLRRRPFIAPHHSASVPALVGGGAPIRPGEISLAHLGVLFLDEMPEFHREVLEALRQPLEDGDITISRAKGSASYPARFMLVGAMNPCPCGYAGSSRYQCKCSPFRVEQYRSRLSGPLVDRIDLFVPMEELSYDDFHGLDAATPETSATIRSRVNAARQIQSARFADSNIHCNGQMGQREIEQYCQLSPAASALLKEEFTRQHFNGRAHARILRLARSIADLEAVQTVDEEHVAEAIYYRQMDKLWSETRHG